MSRRQWIMGLPFFALFVCGCVQLGNGNDNSNGNQNQNGNDNDNDNGNGEPESIFLSYDFRAGSALGWEADVTDFPPEQEGNLQFVGEPRSFPAEMGLSGTGLYVQSFNTPDDLFTFIKRRLATDEGIVANQTYRIEYDIYLASNAPTGCFGVGGSRGESVYLKAGASTAEPLPVLAEGGERFELSVDKGDQAVGGADASLVSTIANGVPCDLIADLENAPYVLLLRHHQHPEDVVASSMGDLWLLIGVDSGFESLTGLFYQRIEVTLEPVE
jgi:hypothetical protein